MQYRRTRTPGATYFFTVVSYNRQHLFDCEENVALLRQAFWTVKQQFRGLNPTYGKSGNRSNLNTAQSADQASRQQPTAQSYSQPAHL